VILFALLGIWAGMTRRPWYVAPTLFLALLWLFVPLEAPEPVVVLLLSVPVLAAACRIARRWLESSPEESSKTSPSRLRFSLADLLWLTLIAGMLTALLIQVWPMPWRMHWPDAVLSAACFCVIGVLVLLLSRRTTWKGGLLTWAVLIVSVFAASGIHQALVKKELLLFSDWEFMLSVPAGQPGFFSLGDVFPVYLCTFIEFVAVLGLGLSVLLPRSARRSPARLGAMLRVAACAVFLTLAVGLGLIYANMLDRPRWPAEQWPEVNEREAFWALLARHKHLNPQEQSIDQLQASGGTAAAQGVAELFDELGELLQHDNITQFDSRYDKPDLAYGTRGLNSVKDARSMARTLTSQAEWDWAAGRHDAALQHDLLCMRLAQAFQRRGTEVDTLVGVSVEGMAVHHLADIRTELSCLEIERIESNLAPLVSAREPLDLLIARNRVLDEEAAGWRGRLAGAGLRMRGVEIRSPGIVATIAAFQRRDAKLAMLRTDLAIRCYGQTHGNWPEDLAALTPDHLATLPVDPYSQQPLVYRATGDDFVLYSVGSDGVDDGGKFGDTRHLFTPGYDLDLETWSRPIR
jgi:hypothetical protein